MLQFGHCPRCASEITSERIIGGTIVCECGWTRSIRSDTVDRSNIDRTCASIIVIGGIVIASFLHAVNWDKYFFTIIPLKVAQIIGTADAGDFERIASICEERKKHDCVEKAYMGIVRVQPANLENLNRLGQLQYKREKYQEAVQTFTKYFAQKGKDVHAAYSHAQALVKLKRYEDAGKYFRFALAQKEDVIQVTVVRAYVQMLVTSNKLRDAKSTILAYRKKSASANMFMTKELEDIQARLGEVVKTASASR